jgi:quercetin dioxygenase-like cupin family protein
MLSGAAVVEIEGTRHRVVKGMTIFVPGDTEHGVVQDVSKEGEMCTWLYVFPSSFEGVEYRFRSEYAY